MGEYIRIDGEELKLGTCEDLYYVTYDQARELLTRAVQVPGNLPPREYLDPKHQWRYRFPFPEEDGRAAGSFDDFNKGRVFSCLPGAPFALSPDNHDTICVSISLGGVRGSGCHNVNTRVACPASGRLDRHSPIDAWPVEIVQQRLMADGASGPSCAAAGAGTNTASTEPLPRPWPSSCATTNATRRVRTAPTGTPSRIASSPATRTRRWS